MAFGGITKDGMSKSKDDSCWICSLRVKTISVLCAQCGMWIHGRSAGVNWVTPKFRRKLQRGKFEMNIGEAVDHEE